MAPESPALHVLVVSRSFPPVRGVGALRPAGFARELSRLGWTVTALTVRRRSLAPSFRDDSLESMVPAAVRRLEARDVGAEIGAWLRRGRAAPSAASPAANTTPASLVRRPRGTIPGRIWRWFTMPDMAFTWSWAAVAAGWRASRSASVVYSSGLPLGSHLAGWVLATTSRRPWVCDFRDPYVWPGVRRFATPLHQAVGGWLEGRIVRAADAVVVANDAFVGDFLERYPEIRDKLCSIPNGYDGVAGAAREPEPGPLRLAHAGQIFDDGALRALVEAMARVRRAGHPIELILLGAVSSTQHGIIQASEVRDAVTLRGRVPHSEVDRILSGADLLVAESCGAIASLAVRAKIFEYARARRPILALTDAGSALEGVIVSDGLGYAFDPGQVPGLTSFLEDMDRRKSDGRSLFPGAVPDIERLSRTARTRALDRVLRQVMAARGGHTPGQEPAP